MASDLMTEGDAHLKSGNLQAACESFQKHVQGNPQDPVGHMKIGHCLKIDGKNKEAVAAYERSLELAPQNLEALYNCADACVFDIQYEKGAALFEKFLALADPSSGLVPKAKDRMGFALACLQLRQGAKCMQEGKFQEALPAYQKAVELAPDYCRCHLNLGTAYEQLGQADEALRCYEKSVELNPDYVLGWFNAAVAYRDRGWFRRGLRALESAMAADKEHKEQEDILKLTQDCTEGLVGAENELKDMLSGKNIQVNSGRAAQLISGVIGDVIKSVDTAVLGSGGRRFIAYSDKGPWSVELKEGGALDIHRAA